MERAGGGGVCAPAWTAAATPPRCGAQRAQGSPLPRAMPSEYRQPRCVAGAGASAREEQGGRIGAGKRLGGSGGVEVGGWSQRGWRVGPLRRDPRRRRWPTTPLPNSVKHAQTTYGWKRGEGAGGGRGHPTTRTQVPTGAGGKSAGARRTAHPSGAVRRLPSRAPCVSWRAVVAARLGRLPAVLMRAVLIRARPGGPLDSFRRKGGRGGGRVASTHLPPPESRGAPPNLLLSVHERAPRARVWLAGGRGAGRERPVPPPPPPSTYLHDGGPRQAKSGTRRR